LAHPAKYGVAVTKVRQLQACDVDDVVALIAGRLADDATVHPLINPAISRQLLADSLLGALHETWVAEEDGRIVGHLYGALLQNDDYGQGAWIGPDGASFPSIDVLSDLYRAGGASWIEHGALEHYVWTLEHESRTTAWHQLGFARMHLRGVMVIPPRRAPPLPAGYRLRRGNIEDLDLAVTLDTALDWAQRQGPSFSISAHGGSKRGDLYETLVDPEVHHYIVEFNGEGVAQCITFPLPPRRGSFDDTLHLSAVVVLPEHQSRGIATAIVDHALANAADANFHFVETNWRVTNRRAQSFWCNYGFQPTYVRLHRTIGSG
jgi:GNAT superfamily N-acetyltransferase